jgi:hypothetical protein
MGRHLGDLVADQAIKVIDMQDVADLQASAAEPVVGERPPEEVARRPEDDEPLVDFAHLPWSRQHPATINHSAQPVEGRVFGNDQL